MIRNSHNVAVAFFFGAVSLGCVLAASEATLVSATEPPTAVRGENFSLRPGESISIDHGALVVGFIRVTSDSRCPRGDRCFSEGDATVRIWVQPRAMAREEREVSVSGKEPRSADSNYEVRLMRLDPQPVSGRSTDPGDYVATLQVMPARVPSS